MFSQIHLPRHPWHLPQTALTPAPELPPPVAGALEIQFFRQTEDPSRLWLGKCSPRALGPADGRPGRHIEEYLEALGMHMYRLLGVDTPNVALCWQPVGQRALTALNEWAHLPGNTFLHICSQYISNLQLYGENFIAAYRTQSLRGEQCYHIDVGGLQVPLRGLGRALAAADLLHDVDCFGNTGRNIGYVFKQTADGGWYASTLKIDPGAVFSFLAGSMLFGIAASEHDPLGRDLWIGPMATRLHFEDLMPADQEEFIATVQTITQTRPEIFATLAVLACSEDGLSPAHKTALLAGLEQRKRRLIAAFAPEIQTQNAHYLHQHRRQVAQTWSETTPAPTQDHTPIEARSLNAHVEGLRIQEVGQAGQCWSFQRPQALRHFVGRVSLLTQMGRALHQGEPRSLLVHGFGGNGKTCTALQYVGLYESLYQRIIWLHAEAGLEIQVRILAALLCGITTPVPLAMLITQLHNQLAAERTLWVFDNAEDEATAAFFPRPSATNHVILTSRQAQWAGCTAFAITGFTPDEGKAYIETRLGLQNEVAIQRLLETVGHYPLALTHAVSYIHEGLATLEEYPRYFYLHQLRSTTSFDPALDTVRTSLTLSLVHLRRISPLALRVLQSCAGLAAEKIPLEFFVRLNQEDLATVRAHVGVLVRYSLITLEGDGDSFNVHRVLVALLDELWVSQEQRTGWLKAVGNSLTHFFQVDYPDIESMELARIMVPHVMECIERLPASLDALRAKLADGLGLHYFHTERLSSSAKIWFERALAIKERLYDADSVEVATTLEGLGQIYEHLDDTTRAKALLERALAIKTQHYGTEHLEVTTTLAMLAGVYTTSGEAARAKAIFEYVLLIYENHYGPNHIGVAKVLFRLADTYGPDALLQAIELYERALIIFKQKCGPNHVNVAITLANLGNAHGMLGNITRQKELYECAMAIFEQHYDADNEDALKIRRLFDDVTNSLEKTAQLQVCPEHSHQSLQQPSAALTPSPPQSPAPIVSTPPLDSRDSLAVAILAQRDLAISPSKPATSPLTTETNAPPTLDSDGFTSLFPYQQPPHRRLVRAAHRTSTTTTTSTRAGTRQQNAERSNDDAATTKKTSPCKLQ